MDSISESAERHYLAGLSHREAGELDIARHHFERAVRLDPNHARAHARLGGALVAEGQISQAKYHVTRAVELAPEDQDVAITFAAVLEADRQGSRVEAIVNRLMRCGNESSHLALLFATISPRLHREQEALDFISRRLRNDPSQSRRIEASLHFSAASLLNDLGRYDEAFAHATTANSLRGVRYNPGQVERPIREWSEYFTRPTLRRLPRAMHESELPVFVVGMPRSGTTLVEQILASHPAIHGAGELRWLFHLCELLALRLPTGSGALSDCFDRMSIKDAEELAEEYLKPLAALNPGAKRIVDKMPTNFMHLGMIELLFPFSKVIFCRREPLDTCLSCFMTDFAAGNDYSFSLPSVGHYYRQHERMMAHWKSVLHLSILDVHYEAVVDDVEGQARRMLKFLEMPWDEHCLAFHENQRFIATASNAQVRRPIYRTSVGRWRNYQRHLGPLREALGSSDSLGTAPHSGQR